MRFSLLCRDRLGKYGRKTDVILNGNDDIAIEIFVKFGVADVVVLKKAFVKQKVFIGVLRPFSVRTHCFTSLRSEYITSYFITSLSFLQICQPILCQPLQPRSSADRLRCISER